MTLTAEHFEEFFQAVNGGHSPFHWQRRLLDHLLEHGRWPEHISAPTGSGKSNVVDVHIFANALVGVGAAPRLPRRLAVVVNRRALVDNHHLRAIKIRELMSAPDLGGILAEVARGLASLRPERSWVSGQQPRLPAEPPLLVAQLRGGVAPERGWVDDPTVCAVIAATPDMWGSRLLMRGYGSRSYAWPREAGLLAYDAAVVIDEAHLNRQLVLTARRVAALEAVATDRLDLPALQVIDTTATPVDADPSTAVSVRPEDLGPQGDAALKSRLTVAKTVRLSSSPVWPTKRVPKPHIEHIVAEVEAMATRNRTDPRPVGCIVNRVETAIQVSQALDRHGLTTATWVGRLRPVDVDHLQTENPALFSSGVQSTNRSIDVLIATQTVEVGVDLDLAGLVTELASAAAIAQRAGRVNRIGRADDAEVVVVVPSDPGLISDYPPYREVDLRAGMAWLDRRAGDPAGLAPWALVEDPAPAEERRRMLFQRPELYDAWWWSSTSENLFAPIDLTLFLRDDLDADAPTAGLVLRDFAEITHDGGEPDQSRILELLGETPPATRETFDVTLWTLKAICARALEGFPDRVFRSRDGEITSLLSLSDGLRPGDVVIAPKDLDCLHAGVPTGEPGNRAAQTYWGDRDVRLASRRVREALVGLGAEAAQQRFRELETESDVQVVIPRDSESSDELAWVLLKPPPVVQADTELLQSSGPAGGVALAQHQANVESRARAIATSLGLSTALVEALALAGRLHDEGKRDPRFQRTLDPSGTSPEVLAKSRRRSAQQSKRDRAASGLRTGWRHEQLSAAIAYAADSDGADRDLVTRLAGTSHGRGRSIFDHPPEELRAQQLDDRSARSAMRLFGADGAWEQLIDSTHMRWGVWGCAFLEALLRAADCQVSREGS